MKPVRTGPIRPSFHKKILALFFFPVRFFLFFSVWGPGVSHLAYYQNRKKQRNPEAPGRLEKMQFAPEPYLCFFNPVLLFLLESVRTILDNFE